MNSGTKCTQNSRKDLQHSYDSLLWIKISLPRLWQIGIDSKD